MLQLIHHGEKETNMDNDSIAPSTKSKVKSSVQRGIRQNFLDSYPGFEPFIDEILPKKAQLDSIKLFVPPPNFSIQMDITMQKKEKKKEMQSLTQDLTYQTRKIHPLHNRLHPPLLPTPRRPSNPTPQAHPRVSHRPPQHPNRPRRHPLRALGRGADGARTDFARGPAARERKGVGEGAGCGGFGGGEGECVSGGMFEGWDGGDEGKGEGGCYG